MSELSKAPKRYWDTLWSREASLPVPFTSRGSGANAAYRRGLHEFFVGVFRRCSPGPTSILEVGCARSQFLPYFALEHGLAVSGLDYSATGCAMSRAMLEREGIEGTIYCADLFDPPRDLAASGVVASFGVIEHFHDTTAAVGAKARLARPGGYVLTVIPNMRGLPGWLQRNLDREVYDLHVPLRLEQLTAAHEAAGLVLQASGHVLPAHLGVCNVGKYADSPGWRRSALLFAVVASTIVQWFSRAVPVPTSAWLSPYLYVLARRPADSPSAAPR